MPFSFQIKFIDIVFKQHSFFRFHIGGPTIKRKSGYNNALLLKSELLPFHRSKEPHQLLYFAYTFYWIGAHEMSATHASCPKAKNMKTMLAG